MTNCASKFLLFLNVLAFLCAPAHYLFVADPVSAQSPARQNIEDNKELIRLHDEDQADRIPDMRAIDWSAVGKRDRARLARVKELYEQNKLQTGADYYRAGLILQHGELPEDFLLAHELCIVAISKGEPRAKWLAAASEDRFLTRIGRRQRFATQYSAEGNGPYKLSEVDPGVTDALRREFNVPSLAEAKAREVELNKK